MTDTSRGASVEATLQLGDAYQVLLAGKRGQYVALLDGRRGWIDVHVRQEPRSRTSIRGRARQNRLTGFRLPASTETRGSKRRTTSRQHHASTPKANTMVRTRVTVRLHVKAGIHARVLTLVRGHTPVRVLGRSGNWVDVQLRGGRQGYVYGLYLTGR